MKEDAESTETTSRRHFTKAVITAAVAAPIAASLAACSSETPQNNSAGQATPPAKASPGEDEPREKDKKKPRPPDDGSTITVGGGGGLETDKAPRRPIWCKFYEQENYPEPAGGTGHKTFVNNKGWHLASLKINEVDLTSFLPADGNCKIEVSCEGSNNNITFFGRELAVRFHTGKWTKNGNQHTSTKFDRHVSTVALTIPRSDKPGSYFEWQFLEEDDCEVKVSGVV